MRNPIVSVNGVWRVKIGNTAVLLNNLGAKHNPERLANEIAGRKGKCGGWNKGVRNKAQSLRQKGSNNPNWKNGASTEAELIRKSLEYKNWRKAVFERDNYTCVLCGYKKGNGEKSVNLNADHIKPFSMFPELRMELSNGRTLCEPCHQETDTFSIKIKTYEKRQNQLTIN